MQGTAARGVCPGIALKSRGASAETRLWRRAKLRGSPGCDRKLRLIVMLQLFGIWAFEPERGEKRAGKPTPGRNDAVIVILSPVGGKPLRAKTPRARYGGVRYCPLQLRGFSHVPIDVATAKKGRRERTREQSAGAERAIPVVRAAVRAACGR